MKKITVLYVITKATWGGAQRYVYDLATNLPKNEFEPIVAYGVAGKLAHDLAASGIKTRQLSSLGRDIAITSDIKSFFEIFSAIKEIRPDVVHLNSSKATALGALAARISGVSKIIFTVHGWPFGEKRNIFAKAFIYKISLLTALLSRTVICVSKHDLQTAIRMPFIRKKAVLIYNGIDLSMRFGSGDVIRRAFPPGVKIVGTIGELAKNKDQRALIEEARHDPTMFVAIVGEGEERSRLEGMIKTYNIGERVKLFGFIPASDALRGFDRFSLPSLKEGLPYALLEAKLAGVPVVANRVGGVGEILDAQSLRDFSIEKMLERTVTLYY